MGAGRRLGFGKGSQGGGREGVRGTDMISGTCGQEVGVYYDASEMYAAAAGLAEANRGPGGRRDEAKQRGDEGGE